MLYARYHYQPSSGATAEPPAPSGTPYADLCVSLGAVAYWDLQDTTGTDSINGYDLTWSGGTPATGTGPGGELTACIDLEKASSQFGYTGDISALRPTAISVIGWFLPEDFANGENLWGCGNTGFNGYQLGVNGEPGITGRIKNGSDTIITTYAYNDIGDGPWHFVAQTYDKAYHRVYEDAVLMTQGEDAGTFDIGYGGSEPFRLGEHTGSSTSYDGLVAGVAVFPSGLSQTNIQDLYGTVVS